VQFISAMMRLNQILSRTYRILIDAGDKLSTPPEPPRASPRRSLSSGSEDSNSRPSKRKRQNRPPSDMEEDIDGSPHGSMVEQDTGIGDGGNLTETA
jgi:hypothetical protein